MTRRIVKSWSNGRLIAAAAEFISLHSETVAILPGHLAGEELAHSGRGLAGFHRTTLVQLAIDLARPTMAERGLAPLSNLGLEALAARVVHAASSQRFQAQIAE